MDRDKWIEQDPAQVTILVNMITWVAMVEKAFTQLQSGNLDALKDFLAKNVELLKALIKRVQGDLEKPLRQKIMVLITMDTHSRDVIIRLINEQVKKPDEFQWQSQLKFYWSQKENNAKVQITDATLEYGYEYLGNGARLVITPLTDRIYVTATQALHLSMGCAPAGPAGTGKTETTKDLASACGKACYVFNCSGEMNYESMGNIFKGLASSGSWGCFDEFNRLVPEVLSVCSVQFKSVTDAIRQKKKMFILQEDEIRLDPTCGVFITMNPGYLGRSELPEGLKSLFRPITVVVPDLELICENMLMAEGFIDAKDLATKFTTLYSLCRDLLSKAKHYDWGLRAIKSVLVVAGAFKRAEPNVREQALLMRALRDFNTPKIVQQDLGIFFGLLGDLFPNINIERKQDMAFEKVIESTCREFKLYPDPEFVLKIVQLKELLEIRHCVFVMGPPGAGKTSVWRMLAESQNKVGQKTTVADINPKVISTKDLYGYIIMATKEWKDGLLSKTLRSLGEISDTNPKWILLDGDLDANWIESMNSVMDDNKILTLASNERIPLKNHMRQLFEIRDLNFATPATVSRAGILYISDDKGTQWRSYVQSWAEKYPDSDADNFQRTNLKKFFFEKYFKVALEHVERTAKPLIPMSKMAMVITTCKALDGLLKDRVLNLEYLFVYAAVWAIGAAFSDGGNSNERSSFLGWWKNHPDWKVVKFPGDIFEYYIDQSGDSAKFEKWEKIVPTIEYDSSKAMQSVTVPTPETVSVSTYVRNLIHVNHGSLLVGMAGSGKTQLMRGLLQEINAKQPDAYLYQIISFNYYTEAEYLQGMMEQTLEKKGGRQRGPRGKAKLIYFIDDLNMSMLDPYNTQTAIALLRQHADYGHWYDITKLSPIEVISTMTVAAMNPTAGSFYVNARYQRHFWHCAIPFPKKTSIMTIYNTFMNGHFKKFKPPVLAEVPNVVISAYNLHNDVEKGFKKTAINFHYEFNIRHLSGVFQGLLLAKPDQFQDPEKLFKMWVHESERIYGDRLVTENDIQNFRLKVADQAKKNFSRYNPGKYFNRDKPEPIIFCDFVNGINNDRNYDNMPNDKLEMHIAESLKEYNEVNAVMDLVMFDDAMRHVCKITRIIRQSSGHALLVGVGGSGKQSLSKLSAFICQYTPFQIVISSNYGMNELKTDLQNLYTKTGVKDEGILFLFTDGQITNERFLVYINDLLSSGEIADLYLPEEKDNIVNVVRPKVKNDGIPDTPDNCWNWYINRVRQNLHMSLCFSPVGEAFRRRARQFPALVNCTVIDWFQPWPKEALKNVATQFLKEIDLGDEDVR
jgi:dynein heavy chain